NQSAQWRSSGRHNVPTVKMVGPNDVVTDHCVEHCDHLAHDRDDHDLVLLTSGLETIVEHLLRHIDSAKREHGHLRTPSSLMRARAQATVWVWNKRPELQAHSRFTIQDGCALPVATGAVS